MKKSAFRLKLIADTDNVKQVASSSKGAMSPKAMADTFLPWRIHSTSDLPSKLQLHKPTIPVKFAFFDNSPLVGGWTTHLKNMLVKLDHFSKFSGWKFQKSLSCHHYHTFYYQPGIRQRTTFTPNKFTSLHITCQLQAGKLESWLFAKNIRMISLQIYHGCFSCTIGFLWVFFPIP